jgi:subtilisin family serine protease
MKRWGLVGLMAMVACAPENTSYRGAQGGACPGVTAGALEEAPPAQAAVPGERDSEGRASFIIRYRDDAVSATSRVHQLGGRVTATYRNVPAVAARLTEREREDLARDPRVESIEPDQVWQSLGATHLPALSFAGTAARGFVSGEYTDGVRRVQAHEVWDLDGNGLPDPGRPTGRGVRVCIIDSGLDLNHPELRDAVVAKRDFLEGDDTPSDGRPGAWGSGHGTHVAGIIAARPGAGGRGGPVLAQGRGLVGVAPEAELVIARVLDIYGRTQMSIVLTALEYCANKGAKVASLSLGGGFASRTTLQAFKAAHDSGMLVVAASGNDGGHLVSYPASDPSVLAVGAVDLNDKRADFSAGGEALALMAPGVDVLSTFPTGHGSVSTLDVEGTQPMSRSLLYAPVGSQHRTLVDCGEADTMDSCAGRTCSGFIAYVRPGRVPVDLAMVNVMMQGATAVIFGNEVTEDGDGVDILALPQKGNWVPAITVNPAGGTMLSRKLGYPVRINVEPADYTYMSGTSMATPHVSAVAALLFSAHPTASPDQVRQAMLSTAQDLGPAGFDEGYGHGLVQAKKALDAMSAQP